jgi:hypothetical protein
MSKRVLFVKATNQPVPDFQLDATTAVLRANATRQGYGATDIEVRVVGDATYATHEAAYVSAKRAEKGQGKG